MSATIAGPARAGVRPAPLSRDHVIVWRAALSAAAAPADLATLDGRERGFASRLRVGADAWVGARAFLRRVLAGRLGIAPRDVPIGSGPNGKPRLVTPASPDLRFNLSHSEDVALVAVRLGHEVGVDVERLREDVDVDAIAREVLDPAERAVIGAAAAADRRAVFFRAWVRREALAKAAGTGLLGPAPRADGRRLDVRDLDGIPGFAAAVASEGRGWSVRRVEPGDAPVP